MGSHYRSLEWRTDHLRLLDQRLLPQDTRYLDYSDPSAVADAIRDMVVRGAPAIGATAAYGLVLAAQQVRHQPLEAAQTWIAAAAHQLRASRPTAVNLFWAIERVMQTAKAYPGTTASPETNASGLFEAILETARQIEHADIATNRAIGQHGLALVPDHALIVHHCNTGSLATVDYGTALGVIRAAHEAGKGIHVLVDETRPRCQGARLTAWELGQLGIPHEIIVDGAAAHLIRTRRVSLCVVGCDRVAANGDVANKIGTYHLALAARAHQVPFYVAAPTSTIDLATATGDEIEIEYRSGDEVLLCGDTRLAPPSSTACNPAFDITLAEYVTAFITEKGIIRPPYGETLKQCLAAAGNVSP